MRCDGGRPGRRPSSTIGSTEGAGDRPWPRTIGHGPAIVYGAPDGAKGGGACVGARYTVGCIARGQR